MGFSHGLAVVLVIFEGIIILCEGTGDPILSRQDAPTNDIRRKKATISLPSDVIEKIVSETDYRTIKEAVRWGIVPPTDPVMTRILQNHIILIKPLEFDGGIHEYYQHGELFLRFGKYQELTSFFDRFGNQVKKIEFWYENDVQHNEINENIIKRFAKNLEEVRIVIDGDEEFWEGISDEENGIIFPEVKKFQLSGDSTRNEFKLNSIFPKLESFKLDGDVADENCLANVKTLKELMLFTTDSIQEDQLKDIFANNENITKLTLSMPLMAETMHWIAKYLTKLETLEVESPGEDFMLRKNNNPVYELPSVIHFNIIIDDNDEIDEMFGIGNLSFDMPKLKKLTLEGYRPDDRIDNFIKQFEKLEILELFSTEFDIVECIGKLKHIKEFTTTLFKNIFVTVENMFKNFDTKSEWQTLKFVNFDDLFCRNYEATLKEINEDKMKEINIHLAESMKPTWTLSHGEQIETGEKYLMFKRDP